MSDRPIISKKKRKGMTSMQRLFCHEYLIDLNGTEAAIRAGYSPLSAAQISYDLLRISEVKKRIEELMDKRASKIDLSADKVLQEIAKIAFVDIRDLFTEDGDIKPVSEWNETLAASVAGLEIEALFEGFGQDRQQIGKTKKIKMNDKLKALELLGRHLVLFKDKIEVGGLDGLADMIAKARKRAE